MTRRELTWGGGWGDHHLLLDGKQVGTYDEVMLRERVTVWFEQEEWLYAKEFGGDIRATRAGSGEQMSAEKRGVFMTRWEVRTAAGAYQLKGSFGPYDVTSAGRSIGTAAAAGPLTSRGSVELDDDVPLRDHVFLCWVATVIRRRRSSGGGAATGGDGDG